MFDLNFPRSNGAPQARAVLKQQPGDFMVDEELGFSPCGDGEHIYLQLRKTGRNTEEVEALLARCANVPRRQVSCSGLKDRNAITSQWFSVHLPGKTEPDWQVLEQDGVDILNCSRHNRKLRRGAHKANRFSLRLRQLEGDNKELEQRLVRVQQQGFSNYFGSQRFGHGGSNLHRAAESAAAGRPGRRQRGYMLSAARSWLFNQVLASRISDGSWQRLQDGDVAALAGSSSIFAVPSVDDELLARCDSFDIHPSGPLWGRGQTMATGASGQLEQAIAARYPEFTRLLEQAGLKQERRPLRCMAEQLQWNIDGATLNLSFSLPRGCYATALVDELVITNSKQAGV